MLFRYMVRLVKLGSVFNIGSTNMLIQYGLECGECPGPYCFQEYKTTITILDVKCHIYNAEIRKVK